MDRSYSQPVRELVERGRLAAPEVTDGIAVPPVPFRPQRREVADLVAAPADIPRLSDELDLGYDLLGDLREHREVRSGAFVGGTQRIGPTGPGLDGVGHLTPCRTAAAGFSPN